MLAVAHAPRESSRVDPSAGPGALVGGRYRLEQRLGAGAMGEVWLAEHVSLRSKVALKLVETAGRPNAAELCARFQHEAQAAARIESPFVVRVLDHGVDGTLAFLAMEVLRGESLDQRLLAQGKLSPEAVTLIVAQMALAIDAAHRMGVVHRDLKPANVLLVRATLGAEPGAPCEMAKVVDFGIAKTLGDDRDAALQTQAGVVLGTPVYMSPEQVTGDELDRRSDLWQLGVITYECLVGALPFQGTALGEIFMRICGAPLPVPSARAPSLPAAFDAWFARACARDRGERFQDSIELAQALAEALGTERELAQAGVTPRAGHLARPPLTRRLVDGGVSRSTRSPLAMGVLLGAVLGLAALLVGLGVWLSRSAAREAPAASVDGSPKPSSESDRQRGAASAVLAAPPVGTQRPLAVTSGATSSTSSTSSTSVTGMTSAGAPITTASALATPSGPRPSAPAPRPRPGPLSPEDQLGF
jgi:serine/threonine protein kinase